MKLSVEGQLRRAVWGAFAVGAVLNSGSVLAQEKDATQLQGVEVTGSRIRRVDTETSNTVQVLDRKQIVASGASTLGDLLLSIPAVSGSAFNNQTVATNNGSGQAFADLRGLGSQRTLVLLDGQRLNNNDLNAIPSNFIERVEVLKEGAAAVYGTDAIGGVINFITRKTFTGVEVSSTLGITEKGDGQHGNIQLTTGTKFAGGNIVFGAEFNRQDEIYARDRDSTKNPAGYYYGAVLALAGASTRNPQGRFKVPGFTPTPDATDPTCSGNVLPTPNVYTLRAGRTGTSSADFRPLCANYGSGFTDLYNFNQVVQAQIPSKRFSFFGGSTFSISDNIKWVTSGYFNKTRTSAVAGAEVFDSGLLTSNFPNTPIVVSAQNVYNPFGQDITQFGKRSTDVGSRVYNYTVDTTQFSTGLRGTVLERFQWDAGINYGRTDQLQTVNGYQDFTQLLSQLGPSFYDASGVARCGTPGAVILGCVPINIFGTTGATLAQNAVVTNFVTNFDETDITANITGDLFKLPAGAFAVSLGGAYRTLHYSNIPDSIAQAFHLSENNSKPTTGGYNVREAYIETHIPILAGLPLVKSLDFNVGGRYSNYSSFGGNASGKYAIEYRPYSDLLLRGTYNDVYRAPTTADLYAGAAQNAPTITDPCNNVGGVLADGTNLSAHPVACAGVPVGYQQPQTQANANAYGNPNLKPEKGYSTDFGFVYNPSFYKPLSIEADLYHYVLNGAIDQLSFDTIVNACYNDETSQYCGNSPLGTPYVQRDPATGEIVNGYQGLVNSNQFEVRGVDFGFKLNYPKVNVGDIRIGRIAFSADANYVDAYHFREFDPATGALINDNSLAGRLGNDGAGPKANNVPRMRALGFLFWSRDQFSASVSDRYVGDVRVVGTTEADGKTLHNIGYANYIDISMSYTLPKISTEFTVGVNDAFSEGGQSNYAPGYYGGAAPGYDLQGRNFFARFTTHFK